MSVCRSTVMMLLAVMDPEGTRQRKMHRLQRRTYENMTLVDNGLYDCDVEHQYHTAGYVFGPLLQQELKEFKDMWNCHRIRRNRFAACPCDVPDDVYNLYSFMGEDYRQSIDPGLLAHCMVHCAHNAPPFYPPEFQVLADNLLSDLFLTQGQITVHNCKAVYLYMVYELSTLL
ncbi:hypothetical protein EMCRGX_G015298 [Ephydatia muelleri]